MAQYAITCKVLTTGSDTKASFLAMVVLLCIICSHPCWGLSDHLVLNLDRKSGSILSLCSVADLAKRTSGLCRCHGCSPTRQQESSSAGMTRALVIHRKSFEFEDASSLQSMYPSSPTENGTESQPKFGSKSTLEENAYEDIVGKQWPGWRDGSSLGYRKTEKGGTPPGSASFTVGSHGPVSGTSQGNGRWRKQLSKD